MSANQLLVGKMATVVAGAVTVLLGCESGRAPEAESAPEAVAVGALVPLTGPGSEMGPATRRGFDLYWEQHPELAGRQVETFVEDNKGTPREGLNGLLAIQARAGQNLVLLLTQLSGVAATIAPRAASSGFLQFGLAAAPALLDYPRNYRTYASADRIGARLAEAANLASQGGRVFVLAMADEYGRAVADAFAEAAERQALTLVGEDLFPPDLTELNSVAQRALRHDPEAIVVTGFGRAPVNLIRQLRQLQYGGDIFGDPAAAYRPYTELIGDAAEGLYVVDLDFPSPHPTPEAERFWSDYTAKFGEAPDLGNALAYASMEIFAEAVRLSHSLETDSLASVLDQGFTVATALGQATIRNRDTEYPLVVKVIHQGEARQVNR